VTIAGGELPDLFFSASGGTIAQDIEVANAGLAAIQH